MNTFFSTTVLRIHVYTLQNNSTTGTHERKIVKNSESKIIHKQFEVHI